MKKLLCLIICMSVILCSLPGFAAVNTANGNYSEDINDMYGLLENLGILSIDLEQVDADNTYVSRQDFAQYIANALDIKAGEYTDDKFFTDVVKGSVINDLCSLGYVKPADKFETDRNITNEEACIMAVRALGYESYVSAMGGSAANYIKTAKKLDLYVNTDTTDATYVDVIELLFNMLHTCVFDASTFKNNVSVYSQSDETLLSNVFDIEFDEGIIAANSYLSVYKNVEIAGKGQVVLNGNTYDLPTAEDYVGCYVRLYHEGNTAKNGVYVYAMSEYNDKYELTSEDIKSASFKSVSYYTEDDKTKTISLNNPLYVHNGQALFGYSSIEIAKLVKVDKTDITVIKHNSNDVNDIVFINTYINGTVKTVATEKNQLFADCYGSVKGFSIKNDGDNTTLIYENGVLSTEKALKADQLVSIYESFNKNVVKIEISAKKVTGMVESVNKSSGSTYYTINGEKYKLDKDADLGSVSAGSNRTFKVDAHNLIVDVEFKTDGIIGYIYQSGTDGGLSTEHKFKIFDELGQHKVYKLAKNVELDGVKLSAADADAGLLQDDGSHRQFIIFDVNANDEIIKIDSCKDQSGLRMVGKKISRKAFKYNNEYAGYRPDAMDPTSEFYVKNSNTKLFTIPEYDPNCKYNEDMFDVQTTYKHELDHYYTCELYKTNDESEYLDFVVEYESSYSNGSEMPGTSKQPGMVAYIYNQLNNDEVDVMVDVQYHYGIGIINTLNLSNYVNVMKVNGDIVTCAKEDIANYIGEGDVVQCGVKNVSGKCGAIRILFDYSEEQTYYGFDESGTYKYSIESSSYNTLAGSGSNTRGMYGYVYDFTNQKDVNFSIAPINADNTCGDEYEVFGGSVLDQRLVVFDSGKERSSVKVSLNALSDVTGYKASGEAKQKVFIYYSVYTSPYPFFYK